MLDHLLADVRADEGFKTHVYDDATGRPITKGSVVQGYPTVGWGFCLDVRRGKALPRDIADIWLRLLAAEIFAELTSRAPWVMAQPIDVQRALFNMAYQLGVSGVLNFKRMCTALRAEDRATAADEALDSDWARKHVARARRIAKLIRGS